MLVKQPDKQNFKNYQHFKYHQQGFQLFQGQVDAILSLRVWSANPELFKCVEQHLVNTSITAFSRIEWKESEITEYWLESGLAVSLLTEVLQSTLVECDCHYALMPIEHRSVQPKLLVFDMDSTLIQMECIDELARQCGFYDQVSTITAAAMRGEIDFRDSLLRRVKLLRNLPEQTLQSLASQLPVTSGVSEMVSWCQQQDIKVAVVSGGFTLFAEQLQRQLKLNYAVANRLEVVNGKLTGQLLGDLVDGAYKREQLVSFMEQLQLTREQVWAIGDGANDIPMIQAAGLGLAFDAKPKVSKQATAAILDNDMGELLALLKHVRDSY